MAVANKTQTPANGGVSPWGIKHTVRLPKERGENAPETEFYAVNGHTINIALGKEVSISDPFYEVMQNNAEMLEAADEYSDSQKERGN